MHALTPILLAGAAAWALAGPARAERYDFTLTGDYIAHFRLDSSPVVSDPDPDRFRVLDVAGSFAGVAGWRNLSFFVLGASGGMTIWQADGSGEPLIIDMDSMGPQVFTGPTEAPTFQPGHYDFGGVGADAGKSMQLHIAAVPEPGTWLMMLAGAAMLGFAARPRF
jgi:hypothetical protein